MTTLLSMGFWSMTLTMGSTIGAWSSPISPMVSFWGVGEGSGAGVVCWHAANSANTSRDRNQTAFRINHLLG